MIVLQMRANISVYSKLFLDSDDDSWSASPTTALMRRLHHGDGSARWIARIGEHRISIGDPVSGDNDIRKEVLYLPPWFNDSIGIVNGELTEVHFEMSEDLQRATSLTFKVIGDIPRDLDVRDLLEEPLSQLGVLEVGQMIPVPALDGVLLILEQCDPEGVVFLDGADIALNIIDDSEPVPESVPESVPEPVHEPVYESDSYDEPIILPNRPTTNSFIPFQGTGHRLGSA